MQEREEQKKTTEPRVSQFYTPRNTQVFFRIIKQRDWIKAFHEPFLSDADVGKIDFNFFDNGETPLHYAVLQDKRELLLELLEYGCPGTVNLQNEAGRTPLHLAREKKLRRICKVLENAGGIAKKEENEVKKSEKPTIAELAGKSLSRIGILSLGKKSPQNDRKNKKLESSTQITSQETLPEESIFALKLGKILTEEEIFELIPLKEEFSTNQASFSVSKLSELINTLLTSSHAGDINFDVFFTRITELMISKLFLAFLRGEISKKNEIVVNLLLDAHLLIMLKCNFNAKKQLGKQEKEDQLTLVREFSSLFSQDDTLYGKLNFHFSLLKFILELPYDGNIFGNIFSSLGDVVGELFANRTEILFACNKSYSKLLALFPIRSKSFVSLEARLHVLKVRMAELKDSSMEGALVCIDIFSILLRYFPWTDIQDKNAQNKILKSMIGVPAGENNLRFDLSCFVTGWFSYYDDDRNTVWIYSVYVYKFILSQLFNTQEQCIDEIILQSILIDVTDLVLQFIANNLQNAELKKIILALLEDLTKTKNIPKGSREHFYKLYDLLSRPKNTELTYDDLKINLQEYSSIERLKTIFERIASARKAQKIIYFHDSSKELVLSNQLKLTKFVTTYYYKGFNFSELFRQTIKDNNEIIATYLLEYIKHNPWGNVNDDINSLISPDGYSAIHLAVLENRPDILHLLLRYGADANKKSLGSGKRPLHLLIGTLIEGISIEGTLIKRNEDTNVSMVEPLSSANTLDVNIMAYGKMIIEVAISKNYLKIAEALLLHNQGKFGDLQNALLSAASIGEAPLLRLLIRETRRKKFKVFDHTIQEAEAVYKKIFDGKHIEAAYAYIESLTERELSEEDKSVIRDVIQLGSQLKESRFTQLDEQYWPIAWGLSKIKIEQIQLEKGKREQIKSIASTTNSQASPRKDSPTKQKERIEEEEVVLEEPNTENGLRN